MRDFKCAWFEGRDEFFPLHAVREKDLSPLVGKG